MAMTNSRHENKLEDPQNDTISRSSTSQAPCSWNLAKLLVIFVIWSMSCVLFSVLTNPSSKDIWTVLYIEPFQKDLGVNHQRTVELTQDKLLGGLLPEGLDEKSCLSRYQSVSYRKKPTPQPSSFLISKLRSYEALHKQCGPYTKGYNKTLKYLKSGKYNNSSTDCKYVVWVGSDGLGNRIISLTSAFLYALLTNRVLLADDRLHISDLFYEPFPEGSWIIPSDFPIIDQFRRFGRKSNESFGNMLKNNAFDNLNGSLLPPYIYAHLLHNYNKNDKRFFCDQDQAVLQNVPWLIIKSNQYFIPPLFSVQSFEKELSNLFPKKETVFHFLGRYLFHPTNTVWRIITKHYDAHLAEADEKIGIQIRIFGTKPDPFKHFLSQILDCVINENLLPQINKTEQIITIPSGKSKTKAVFMASLSYKYYEAIKNMYEEHPTVTGEVVQVLQHSHEEYEDNQKRNQTMNAWIEMYLLSLCDKLVTSSTSTFGYVAQGLGGLKPWILYVPNKHTAPNPACHRGVSMEPCFHRPPMLDCKTKTKIDTGNLVPHVRHCEDVPDMWWDGGLKLVD